MQLVDYLLFVTTLFFLKTWYILSSNACSSFLILAPLDGSRKIDGLVSK